MQQTNLKTILATIGGGVVGGLSVWVIQGHSIFLRAEGMSYSELAAILLAVAALVVGVFGIAVGILAFWGYKHFKTVAVSESRKHVEKDLSEGVSNKLIKSLTEQFVTNQINLEFQEGHAKQLLETVVTTQIADMISNNQSTAFLAEQREAERSKFPGNDDESVDA